jgi:GNAT superfamily N-acetyltransferase
MAAWQACARTAWDHALNRFLPRRSGWTDPVLVQPDFQGWELAGALIHRDWQLPRERGAEVACLRTSHRNAKAIAAFTRAGYREVSRLRWYSLR